MMTENEFRAVRMYTTIKSYRECVGQNFEDTDAKDDLIDLLSDLRHFADHEGLDFSACDALAYNQYVSELDVKKKKRRKS